MVYNNTVDFIYTARDICSTLIYNKSWEEKLACECVFVSVLRFQWGLTIPTLNSAHEALNKIDKKCSCFYDICMSNESSKVKLVLQQPKEGKYMYSVHSRSKWNECKHFFLTNEINNRKILMFKNEKEKNYKWKTNDVNGRYEFEYIYSIFIEAHANRKRKKLYK